MRRAQPPGSCPKRPSLRQTPGPTPTPVGFLIAQDGGGRWGSPQPPPLTTRGARTCSIGQGLPFAQLRPALLALGVWEGVRRRQRVTLLGPQRKPHGISRAGTSAVTPPLRRACPGVCSPGRGPGRGSRACSVTARRQPCPVKGGCAPSQTGAAPLGRWAPQGSRPPGRWEQEGCDCLGL